MPTREDIKTLRDREEAEKRVVDILRAEPELMQQVGNRVLDNLVKQWNRDKGLCQEFAYIIMWLGLQRVSELDEEREVIDKLIQEMEEG